MHKLITTLFLATTTFASVAQDAATADTSWKCGGVGAINFNQVSFSNWAAGGENSISGAAYLSLFGNYAKDRLSWENQLDMGYGIIKFGDNDPRKNEDKIDLNSKLGYKMSNTSKFYYTFLFNFKSQFTDGFNYELDPEGDSAVSHFMAPGYFLYSIGIDYKPNDAFSAYLSPLTGRTIVVNDQELANAGAYGVEDSNKTLTQLGAFLKMQYKKDVLTNVNLLTKLELFSNYLKNPQNVAVNFEVLISMKVNKYITANLGTQLIYDDIINVPVFTTVNGVKTIKGYGPRLQFKEVFGVGLSAKF